MRLTLLLFTLLVVLLLVDNSASRFRFRFRTRARFGSSSRSSYGSVPRVTKYSGYNKAIAAGVVVHGMSRYRLRFVGTSHFRKNPTVCYSSRAGFTDNDTLVTQLGYFICPYHNSDSPKYTYCCGEAHEQYCCGYWANGGRVAGAVIGFILAGITVCMIVCCVAVSCCCKDDKEEESNGVALSDVNKTEGNQEAEPMSPSQGEQVPQNGALPYPMYPEPQNPGYPPANPPYPVDPQATAPYPPGASTAYPPGTSAPYPPEAPAPYPNVAAPPYHSAQAPQYQPYPPTA